MPTITVGGKRNKSGGGKTSTKKRSSKKRRSTASTHTTKKRSKSRSAIHVEGPIVERKADENMSLFELQRIARSKGIPFGGLRKTQLIRKINLY